MKHEAEKAAGLKVFVGGLPHTATEEEIREVVEPHGSLKKIDIVIFFQFPSDKFNPSLYVYIFLHISSLSHI